MGLSDSISDCSSEALSHLELNQDFRFADLPSWARALYARAFAILRAMDSGPTLTFHELTENELNRYMAIPLRRKPSQRQLSDILKEWIDDTARADSCGDARLIRATNEMLEMLIAWKKRISTT